MARGALAQHRALRGRQRRQVLRCLLGDVVDQRSIRVPSTPEGAQQEVTITGSPQLQMTHAAAPVAGTTWIYYISHRGSPPLTTANCRKCKDLTAVPCGRRFTLASHPRPEILDLLRVGLG